MTINEIVAAISARNLTPEDSMILLNVISSTLVEPCKGQTMAQLNRDPRMAASSLISEAADQISNIEGVTI